MPRFSLRRLLLGMAVVAIGFGMCAAAHWQEISSGLNVPTVPFYLSGTVIGAGIAYPLHRIWLTWLGGLIGFVFACVHVFLPLVHFTM
jgi:hypothetical protein